jgi:hypothetical protein
MKKILLMALPGIIAFSAKAQTDTKGGGKFNFGIEAGRIFNPDNYNPAAGFNRLENHIFGATVKYEYPLAKNLFLTGATGFTRVTLTGKESDAAGFSGYNYIPLKAGA